MMRFRALTAKEVEVRIGQVVSNEWGQYVILLLYKDARADMNILDETVGSENWQREHYEVKGNLYCRVGINRHYAQPEKEPSWVWKSDCGTESNTEAVKGESSDAFKRSCVCFGIGRELYTAPKIKVTDCEIKATKRTDKSGNPIYACYDDFEVVDFEVKDGRITALSIYRKDYKNRRKVKVYEYGKR